MCSLRMRIVSVPPPYLQGPWGSLKPLGCCHWGCPWSPHFRGPLTLAVLRGVALGKRDSPGIPRLLKCYIDLKKLRFKN